MKVYFVQQLLSMRGYCSRRKGIELIRQEQVTSKSRIISLDMQLPIDAPLEVNGKKLPYKPLQYVIMNKPTGYIVSKSSKEGKTVYSLLPQCYHHLDPVGRLDKMSCGLLLFTNNGHITHILLHPSFNATKTYKVKIHSPLTKKQIAILTQGLTTPTHKFSPCTITMKQHSYYITLAEGQKHQIRIMMQHFNKKVLLLQRVAVGPLLLSQLQLPEGKYSKLSTTLIKELEVYTDTLSRNRTSFNKLCK